MPFADRQDDSGHHIMPIMLNDAVLRPRFRQYLREHGVQTSIHYPPVHLFTQYQNLGVSHDRLAFTNDAAEREVTLPLHPLLELEDVDTICDIVLSALDEI